jgi:hypothetical protein
LKPAITRESNKLVGLTTETEVRRVQDIMEQDKDLILKWPLMTFKTSLNITLVNNETTFKLLSLMITDLNTLNV